MSDTLKQSASVAAGAALAILAGAACAAPGCTDAAPRLDDIQIVGTHNSYRMPFGAHERQIFEAINGASLTMATDYRPRPLAEQLDAGVRSIELDLWPDPQGDAYGDPLIRHLIDAAGLSQDRALAPFEPPATDFKVLHRKDEDYASHCRTFRACLAQLGQWSARHPGHEPVIVFIEAKRPQPPVAAIREQPAWRAAPTFDAARVRAIDTAILDTLPATKLITPAQLLGRHANLREAALAGGWPTLAQARGRFAFVLFEERDLVRDGVRSPASYYLDGVDWRRAAMFVAANDARAPYAAFVKAGDEDYDDEQVRALVAQGFIVRRLADEHTREAHSGTTARRERALASGAQIVITDFYWPEPDFGHHYQVRLPGGSAWRPSPGRPCAGRGG
ncbi:MAG: Ca2+-dependent phosphoinositide-specific phospholipase C [Solimonas sp.]